MSFFISESLKNKLSEEDLFENFTSQSSQNDLSIQFGDIVYKIIKISFIKKEEIIVKIMLNSNQSAEFMGLVHEKDSTIVLFGKSQFVTKDNIKIKSITSNEKENLFKLQILISELGEQHV